MSTGQGPEERIEAARAKQAAQRQAAQARRAAARARQEQRREQARGASTAGREEGLGLWLRGEPQGRRPRWSRDQIAAAAVGIADREGFEALTMRRLAAELGAGTMTVYYYVHNKGELLSLVMDAVMGEVALSPDEELPGDWKAAISLIARRTRDAIRRHPWVLGIGEDSPFGPNSLLHFDQSLGALASLDAPLAVKLDLLVAVDSFVFGYCLQERGAAGAGGTIPHAVQDYLTEMVRTGAYPRLAALVEELGFKKAWRALSEDLFDEGSFDRNLRRLLDGFEQSLGDDFS